MAKIFRIFMIFYVITVIILYLGINSIDVTHFEVASEKLPVDFDGYKIVHVSDLHNKNFKGKLIEKIKNEQPDVIVITGDIVYKRNDDISYSKEFISQAVKIAPVYFVTGNHEYLTRNPDAIRSVLNEYGVKMLEDGCTELKKGSSTIKLWGINDPMGRYLETTTLETLEEIAYSSLSKLNIDRSEYNILLSHRPKYLETYSEFGFDLVFAGHAHGGLVRIPFLGGLIGPGPTFFPKYTAGIHQIGQTKEIISRGLGGSFVNLRVLNNPELVVCSLKSLK